MLWAGVTEKYLISLCLTFICPCIIIWFQVTANKMQRFLIYLFPKVPCMFQAVSPPIIRSTRLYKQLQVLSTNTAASCCREWDGTTLLLKRGAGPLHWWFPGVIEGLRWENCALLITVQKAAPLILMSYLIEINIFTLRIILLSTIVGSIGGLNQTSVRKILTYSSISNTGWILTL